MNLLLRDNNDHRSALAVTGELLHFSGLPRAEKEAWQQQ